MNSATLLSTAIALLAIAALGGIVMALIRFSRTQNPPAWLAMIHGLLAASGLTLIVYAMFTVGIPGMAQAGLALLVLAALGGVILNQKYHWHSALLPSSIVVGHAVLAVAGFVLLLLAARDVWRGAA
jgi:hypothetical protein